MNCVRTSIFCTFPNKDRSPETIFNWFNPEACGNSPTFILSISGDHTLPFRANRGIRPGGPLSPYLYMITTNILNTLIEDEIHENKITPLSALKGNTKSLTLCILMTSCSACSATELRGNPVSTSKRFSSSKR